MNVDRQVDGVTVRVALADGVEVSHGVRWAPRTDRRVQALSLPFPTPADPDSWSRGDGVADVAAAYARGVGERARLEYGRARADEAQRRHDQLDALLDAQTRPRRRWWRLFGS